ncbi:hypothetical protein BsWGS_07053 [Bradybaena similaris]
MQPLRLCVFVAFIVTLRAYELSQNLAEFYCVFNGNFSDREQVERDGNNRTRIDLRFQHVDAPALSDVPVLYIEESMGGVLVRALVGLVTQVEGDIIYFDTYNFTVNSDIRPGTFDANEIKSLTREDIHRQHNCRSVFERVEPFVFSGNYQNCRQAPVKGQRPAYGSTDTCTQLHIIMPAGAAEKPTLVPYNFKLESGKYPLENAPFNNDCDCE